MARHFFNLIFSIIPLLGKNFDEAIENAVTDEYCFDKYKHKNSISKTAKYKTKRLRGIPYSKPEDY